MPQRLYVFTFTQWGQWVVICSWDIRDLWLATHQISFNFLPKIMAEIVWNASKRMSMQWHALRCISGIRQIYNFRWSASALADHQKLSVWFVFLAWIEGTLSTRMQFGFHIFKSCILTESHVTKNDFFLKKFENFDITFFIQLMTILMTYMMIWILVCIVYLYYLRDEIRVFVHCSSTARGHNLDFHSGYR